ncbi:hypothetical protein ACFVUY_42445 [Kitasatospora sp. NPDC058063]|uniref:hypothetical protein n=1 Tax=unclassified Kitasatospora TaxID=2633591 RepID=UPI0036DD6A1C
MDTVDASAVPPRCEAADPLDITPCEGPVDAVFVTETSPHGVLEHVHMLEELSACVHHGARVLASMVGGRVDAGPRERVGWPSGACVEVFLRAKKLTACAWLRPTDPASIARQQLAVRNAAR